jgi:predicted transcriptional regulator
LKWKSEALELAQERSIEVKFDSDQYERLEELARARGQSVATLIQQAVEREHFQRPDLVGKQQAIERLLKLNLPVDNWEEAKEDLIRERSRYFEAS